MGAGLYTCSHQEEFGEVHDSHEIIETLEAIEENTRKAEIKNIDRSTYQDSTPLSGTFSFDKIKPLSDTEFFDVDTVIIVSPESDK